MTTLDVKKAFLKGVTYEELAELTGEAKREANFEVSAETAEILRTILGFENATTKGTFCATSNQARAPRTHLGVSASS